MGILFVMFQRAHRAALEARRRASTAGYLGWSLLASLSLVLSLVVLVSFAAQLWLLGLWMIQLFAAKEQTPLAIPPEQSSAALAITIIRDLVRDKHRTIPGPKTLSQRLREAVKDEYQRTKSKSARYRPPCIDQPTTSGPLIHIATHKLRQLYRTLATAA